MGRRKGTPDRSKLVRGPSPAFSRRQRPGSKPPDDETAKEPSDAGAKAFEAKGDATPVEVTEGEPVEIVEPAQAETRPTAAAPLAPDELPEIEPPAPHAEPWPDATPQPMKPVAPAEPVRQRTSTVAMPVTTDFGRPPDMPKTTAPPPLVLGDVENPTHMPGPREVPSGSPDDPAPPPGHVPPGDSRSLRRASEFALVYRVGTCVITRTGQIGTRGQWRVVEYPTSISASNSYAKECSRFVSEGFSDYRD